MTPSSPLNQRFVDETAVAANRARLAGLNDPPWLNVEVARRMAERLTLFKRPPQRVVDWGARLGGGGPLLMAAYPGASHVVVEPTESVAVHSRGALGAPWWAIWRSQSRSTKVFVDSEPLKLSTDLIWSNMQLHAEKNPPALFERWAQMLSPDGLVMFSCLGPGTVQALRAVYAGQGWPAPTVDFVDMHDLGDMLVRAGFADPVMDQETLTIQWDSPQALCDDLRLLGGNVSPLRFRGLRTARWMASLHRALESLRGSGGKLTLDFEVVYGHAFKSALTRSVDGETRVPLEDIRRLMPSARASN